MLELNDIITPDVPSPPAIPPLVIAGGAVAALAVIALVIWLAVRRKRAPGQPSVAPMTAARDSFADLQQSIATTPELADSLPSTIHGWVTKILDTHPDLPQPTVTALTAVRDQLSAHRFVPPARWRAEVSAADIETAIVAALGTATQKTGGQA